MDERRKRPDREERPKKQPPQSDRHKKQRIFRRTVILMAVFGVVTFAAAIGRLFKVQIVKHEYYQEKAASQQTRDLGVSADRGTIYDSEGNILAISTTVQNLVISPKDIKANELDENLITVGLSNLTGVDTETIAKKLEKTGSQYEVIRRKLEEADAEAVRTFIKDNKLSSGVYLEPDSKRSYPYSSLASHIIGFVGTDNNGLYGAEATFDSALSGVSGRVVTAKNGAGTELLSQYENYIDAQDGLDHHLTINATIQAFAEKALEEGIAKYSVRKGGFCVVMDPNTGGILAMASSPEYDLNNPNQIADPEKAQELEAMKNDPAVSEEAYLEALQEAQWDQWRNRAIRDGYEPGSTFKTLVLAAALEEGVVGLNDSFTCTGVKQVANWPIHCSKREGHGVQDLTTAVKNSCNPAFIEIGQRLGAERLYQYFQDFGLLNLTGIESAEEGMSQIWDEKYFTSEEGISSLAAASFGQTLKITPLQLITAASAAVNGGYLYTPHILDYTTDQDGQVVERHENTPVRQVISNQTSETVRSILEQVVATGTGKNVYHAGYRIGGKTGTSEKRDEKTGDLIVSFLGVAPANDPKVVVLLAYDSPTASSPGGSWGINGTYISGGMMAAPMAGNLIVQILDYMGIERQYTAEELSGADTAVPRVVGYTEEDAAQRLQKLGFTYRKVGDGGTVTDQIPAAGAAVPGGSEIILYMGEERPTEQVEVPDLTGLSPDAARRALAARNLFMKGSGAAGYFTSATPAATQSLPPGTMAEPGTVVEVSFVEQVSDFTTNVSPAANLPNN